jgi:hypothetical protein
MPLLILPKNSDVFADAHLNSLVCMRYNFTECTLKFSDLTPKDVAITDAEKFLLNFTNSSP